LFTRISRIQWRKTLHTCSRIHFSIFEALEFSRSIKTWWWANLTITCNCYASGDRPLKKNSKLVRAQMALRISSSEKTLCHHRNNAFNDDSKELSHSFAWWYYDWLV
jgi:hypothetical protein